MEGVIIEVEMHRSDPYLQEHRHRRSYITYRVIKLTSHYMQL